MKYGEPNVQGKHIIKMVIKNEGGWKDGKWNGQGIEYYEDGEGEWKDGEPNGQGIFYDENYKIRR